MTDLLALVAALVVILVAAELFTNAIEWFGFRLGLTDGAVGSIFAAIGTALPETLIPFIAIVFGNGGSSDEVGVGAILGAPFMLSTLALGLVPLAVLAFRPSRPSGLVIAADRPSFVHDLRYFLGAYALAIVAAFLPAGATPIKLVVAVLLIAIYGLHVRAYLSKDSPLDAEEPKPLRLHHHWPARFGKPETPKLVTILAQVVLGLGIMSAGALVFVGAIESLSRSSNLDAGIVALLVAPVATELPELMNSVLWLRRSRDTLAIGNVTGAMVFQATIPTTIALVFAPEAWAFSGASGPAFTSAGVAIFASAVFLVLSRRSGPTVRSLAIGAPLFFAFVIAILVR